MGDTNRAVQPPVPSSFEQERRIRQAEQIATYRSACRICVH
jgi:hypothetical protein